MRDRTHRPGRFWIALGLLCGLPCLAGGPRYVNTSSPPSHVKWPGTVTFRPDPGPLGLMSNTAAVQMVRDLFLIWTAVPHSSLTVTQGAPLAADITSLNFTSVLGGGGDGISPIVFDHDGQITEAMLGVGNGAYVMGFSELQSYSDLTGTLNEMAVVLNGRFRDGVTSASSPEVSDEVFRGVVLHYLGHFLGLDHSQLNISSAVDTDTGNDREVPTMYPVHIHAGFSTEGQSLHFDDQASFAALYPAGTFASSLGTITGTVRTTFGGEAQGMNVVARLASDPRIIATSSVSGFQYRDSTGTFGTTDSAYLGAFRISGLPPGFYLLEVEPVDLSFRGTTRVGPLDPPAEFGGPVELFSGFFESSDPALDRRSYAAPIAIGPGQTIFDVDFWLNDAEGIYSEYGGGKPLNLSNTQVMFTPSTDAPGGYRVTSAATTLFPHNDGSDALLPLADDGFITLDFSSAGFSFPLFGSLLQKVNICANGFLTFGTPSPFVEGDHTESHYELLGPRPHIAGLWDDLNPDPATGGGGTIRYGVDGGGVYVTFRDVRLFRDSTHQVTFQIWLQPNGSIILTYLTLLHTEGLVGVSSGGTPNSAAQDRDFAALTLDTQPPAITLNSPAHGAAVVGLLSPSVTVTDVAPSSGIAYTELLVDGMRVSLDSTNGALPLLSWDTTLGVNTPRRIEIRSVDKTGNIGHRAIVVNMNNPGAPHVQQRLLSVNRVGSFLDAFLEIKNLSPDTLTACTLNAFWGEIMIPNSIEPARQIAAPPAGSTYPLNLGTLAPGGSVVIPLRLEVPTAGTSFPRWVTSGTVTRGSTTFLL